MASIFHSLLLVIAGSTQRELARQIKYLKVENQILRSKLPARITVTPKERQRLLKFGAKLGQALKELVTIVAPGTFLRWIREDRRNRVKGCRAAKRGRKRTSEEVRLLVLTLARENNWGYKRIEGELRKLRINLSNTTIRNILKEAGLDPSPQRDSTTWDAFLKQHAASIWKCDFFSQKVLTLRGFREIYALAYLNIETRQVIVSSATLHPNERWVVAQADEFVTQARANGLTVAHLVHDNDTKFTVTFDEALRRRRVKVEKTSYFAPDMQAFVERFVHTLRSELLDHFVVFGSTHFDHLVKEFLEYYHAERPHQGVGNELLVRAKRRRGRPAKVEEDPVGFTLKDVKCQKRLGGLLKSYSRAA